MIRFPVLKAQFRYVPVPAGVFLVSENDYYLLHGRIYQQLIPLLDGNHSVDAIVDLLSDSYSLAEAYYAFEILERQSYIAEFDRDIAATTAAYWHSQGADIDTVKRNLAAATVHLRVIGDLDSTPMIAALKANGLHVTDDHGTHLVVITDDYQRAELAEINAHALARTQSWLLAKPVGLTAWLGPIFESPQTACWECLSHRLNGHRKIEHYLKAVSNRSEAITSPVAQLPSTVQLAAAWLATAVTQWIAMSDASHLHDSVSTWSYFGREIQHHKLVRRPQCRACGTATLVSDQQWQPVHLQSRPKKQLSGSGHRQRSAEDLLPDLESIISPITGIVGSLRENTPKFDQRRLTPTYVADHNYVQMSDSLYFLKQNLRSKAGGKGATEAQAKVSALAESIERYAGVYHGNEASITESLDSLGDRAVPPADLYLVSDYQIANRKKWNETYAMFHWVPDLLEPHRPIEWAPVWSLSEQRQRFVPMAYCYYGYNVQHQVDYARADSNGCAAGSSLEEAILQGFLELIERDAVGIWWYNQLHRPIVNLASFDSAYIVNQVSYFREIGRNLWVIDITSDIGIPTFAAISSKDDSRSGNISLGFGAHLDPAIAVARAISELNQMLAALEKMVSQEALYDGSNDKATLQWWHHATISKYPYLQGISNQLKNRSDYPTLWTDDFKTDIEFCVNQVSQRGLETLLLDQSRPDLPLHVAKVIVPGLRHFWARFGPGRLYETPVTLGYRDRPLSEFELNSTFVFL